MSSQYHASQCPQGPRAQKCTRQRRQRRHDESELQGVRISDKSQATKVIIANLQGVPT
jgi:hypothetical protein